jgi:hypothetical protein
VPQRSALSLPREHAAADGIFAEDNEIDLIAVRVKRLKEMLR